MHNENRLKKAGKCGCYYCGEVFDVNDIKEWVDDAPRTAICPYCGIDSVIHEGAVTPFTRSVLACLSREMF